MVLRFGERLEMRQVRGLERLVEQEVGKRLSRWLFKRLGEMLLKNRLGERMG